MRKPIYISFCNQKGGVGKSCFTLLTASYLCYEKGLNVAIWDCDYPQHSDIRFRQWETEQVKNNTYYNQRASQLFERLGRPVYPILGAKPEDAMERVENWLSETKTEYDIVLFDLPGTVNNRGVLHILDAMDYYFTPIEASLPVLESSLSFAATIQETLQKRKHEGKIHLFWNKIDRREKNPLYEKYEKEIIEPLGLPLMQSRFPLSSRFRKVMNADNRSFLISTIFPAGNASVKDTSIDVSGFMNEICTILKITSKDEQTAN